MSTSDKPLLLSLADDVESKNFRAVYSLLFNFSFLFLLAIYGASLLIPRDIFVGSVLEKASMAFPKYQIEHFYFLEYPPEDISYYFSISMIFYILTSCSIIFAGRWLYKESYKYPFTYKQKSQISSGQLIRPAVVLLALLILVPLPVGIDLPKAELIRNPITVQLFNLVLQSGFITVSVAAIVCIARFRASQA
ncbi:hypothetical protein [Sinorhizobium sp. NFACC03]|uniref:hypothetical protein n=1 Tax=Sinorhizobium sp. NFACC03 TaxID=1566295 RepID=UPI00087FA9AF|nr:hypothetical protein [Sinorhizobium sp. NFACC03]SDA99593.1 hypothetical protein SAMN03159448_06625 [Sinorhizobium sp. NFACC03]